MCGVMLNKELDNSKYQLDSRSVSGLSPISPRQREKLFDIKNKMNTTNGMSKLGIPLSILGLGVISSGFGRHKSGQASDVIEQLTAFNDIPYGNVDKSYVAKKIQQINRIQGVTLGLDIATLFVLPAIVTIPASIISNAINWRKTGKLKGKLNALIKNDSIKS
jgi:hypothetical protein